MDTELKRVIQGILSLADKAQEDIDSLDSINSVAELNNHGLILQDIEEHIEGLSFYITANTLLRNKLEELSNKIVKKKLVTLH